LGEVVRLYLDFLQEELDQFLTPLVVEEGVTHISHNYFRGEGTDCAHDLGG